MATFSTPSENAIQQTGELDNQGLDRMADDSILENNSSSFDQIYEIERTCNEINIGGYKNIALQFPDSLLPDSVAVYKLLKKRLPDTTQVYVLADTTYGSCCVDEVAAQHVNADCLVHYGHACMSRTSRLPVIYIFGKRSIDPEHCANELVKTFLSLESDSVNESNQISIKVMFDVAYSWKSDEIQQHLSRLIPSNVKLEQVPIIRNEQKATRIHTQSTTEKEVKDKNSCDSSCSSCCCSSNQNQNQNQSKDDQGQSTSTTSPFDLENAKILFFIGGESPTLTNILMTQTQSTVISYDPTSKSSRIESTQTNRMLGRRYAVVQQARDADVFGLVVGTLGVASYLPLLDRLRKILKDNEKKVYTLAVGKLNPAKLANYQEIECFILVACPENSLVNNPKDFYRPVVTPYELEIALGMREWSKEWITDFDQILDKDLESRQDYDTDEELQFSTITGTYRTKRRYASKQQQHQDNKNADLAEKVNALTIVDDRRAVAQMLGSAAGEHLAQRTYQGLDPRLGMDVPATVKQGRSGIAKGYDHE